MLLPGFQEQDQQGSAACVVSVPIVVRDRGGEVASQPFAMLDFVLLHRADELDGTKSPTDGCTICVHAKR